MSDYRFNPLRDYPRRGILETPAGPQVAEYLTLSTARSNALKRHRSEELEILKRLRAEIKYASDLA
jgi:hypothetical protein